MTTIEFTVNQIQNEKNSFRKMTQFPQQERIIKKNNCAGTTGYPYAK